MYPLAITAFSLVNGLGDSSRAVWEALRAGRSALAPCSFETALLDTFVGQVPGIESNPLPESFQAYDCRNNRLARMALEADGFAAAVVHARARYGTDRIGLFLGTSTSGILETEQAYRHRDPASGALPSTFRYAERHNTYSVGEFTRAYLGLAGPAYVVSAACASTAKVFASAARMIATGTCDAAVVGGADTLCLTTLYGFNSLGLLSRRPCRPYDAQRDGISIGEGAGFVLLERPRAGALALLLGAGESSDAHHMSTPHPEGLGARLAMEAALRSAGVAPAQVDYINLHGTASRTNDASEDRAVWDVFAGTVPCSSTKAATGHLLGASGVTEAVISMLAIRGEVLPGGVHTAALDPALRNPYLLENRQAEVRCILSNSFGFGGSNCALLLGRDGDQPVH